MCALKIIPWQVLVFCHFLTALTENLYFLSLNELKKAFSYEVAEKSAEQYCRYVPHSSRKQRKRLYLRIPLKALVDSNASISIYQ